MKNKIPVLIVMALVSGLLTAVFPSLNVQASLVSDALVEEGVKLYDSGQNEKAIERLSKALIIDPDNKTAKEYLGKMGLTTGLYAPEKGEEVPPVLKMSEEIKEYQDKLGALEQEKFQKEVMAQGLAEDKETLKRAIATQEEELAQLREDLGRMQKQMSFREKLVKPAPGETAVSPDKDPGILKGRIQRQLELIDEKDRQIKALNKQLKASQKKIRQKSLNYENKLVDLEKDHLDYKSKAWRKQAKADTKVAYLQNRLRQSEGAIEELNNNLVMAGHRLADLENQITVKNNDIVTLHKTRSKDCPPVKGASSKCPDAKALKEQDKKIAVLKQKLAKTQKEIVSLRRNIKQGGREDVVALKRQLADISAELKKKNATLADEEAAYEILDQRLKDAQERLNLADQMIQEKDRQIRQMEQQIGDL